MRNLYKNILWGVYWTFCAVLGTYIGSRLI